MPCTRLLHGSVDGCGGNTAGSALVDDFDDMETIGAFDDGGRLARRQTSGCIDKQLRQAILIAPAQITTGQCFAGVGIGRRQFGKVTTGFDLTQHVVSPQLAFVDFFCGRVFGKADQDMGELPFLLLCLRAVGFSREIIIDFGVADLDLVVDFFFAQALQRNFFPNLFAEAR